MDLFSNCLLLSCVPFAIILAGFWLAARLKDTSAAERLAFAALAGIALLLWSVATVNFFKPLSGPWARLCLWPIALTLLSPSARRAVVRDFSTVASSRRGRIVAVATAGFLALLLWPLLTRPSLAFYDGTSNHDAFFWISGAEHLQHHTYFEHPAVDPTHPFNSANDAIVGWRPVWGRMGAEGLLALTSSITGIAPLNLYLCTTAALFVSWIAAVFLVVRTFLVRRLGLAATLAIVVLQPLFVFFHGNENLPNLLGALMAAAIVIATERSLCPEKGRGVWLALIALALHGLLCSYPEMLPFVILPAGLLWLRTWFSRGARVAWRPAAVCALGWIAGIALNPVSSVRAWFGFWASFGAGRADQHWANLFDPLSPLECGPGLATLAVGASHYIGSIGGGLLTLILAIGLWLALRRAVNPLGALFTLSGVGALLAYTLYFHFSYGWQKTAQFGGALWAAVLPVAVLDAFIRATPADRRRRFLARAAAAAVAVFFAYATFFNCRDGYNWSRRKIIARDWFALRDYAAEHLRGAPVLIDSATFPMAFFHSMWATYFLPDNPVYFAARGVENGGYLHDWIVNEGRQPIPSPAGYLVGRDWADTFDANSPRLMIGDTVALLKTANRVTRWTGLYPDSGPPTAAATHVVVDILPHMRSEFRLELTTRFTAEWAGARWRVTCRSDGAPEFTAEISGPPPWKIAVPLTAGHSNHLELTATNPSKSARPWPFAIQRLAIEAIR